MRRGGTVHQWLRLLDASDPDDVVDDLRRHIKRLDDAYADLSSELKAMSPSPNGEVEEMLGVACSAVSECIQMLRGVVYDIRLGGPDEAA